MGAPHGNRNAAGKHKGRSALITRRFKWSTGTVIRTTKVKGASIKKQHKILDAYTRKMEKLYKQK